MSVIEDVTIITKTFERPKSLAKTVKTIRAKYPGVRILVADDSKNPTPIEGVTEYVTLPFDTGASRGRNILVDKVETKYFLTVDDDWNFTKNTKLELMIDILEKHNVDVICGGWEKRPPICTTMKYNEDRTVLTLNNIDVDSNDLFTPCDFSYQLFMVETEKFKSSVQWDDELKTIEHLFLFMDMKDKLRIAHTPHCKIFHNDTRGQSGNAGYMKFRTRKDFFGVGMKKRGVRKFVNYTGKVREGW